MSADINGYESLRSLTQETQFSLEAQPDVKPPTPMTQPAEQPVISDEFAHLFRPDTYTPLHGERTADGLQIYVDANGNKFVDIPDEIRVSAAIPINRTKPDVTPAVPSLSPDETSAISIIKHRNNRVDFNLTNVDPQDAHVQHVLSAFTAAPTSAPMQVEQSALEGSVIVPAMVRDHIIFEDVDDQTAQDEDIRTASQNEVSNRNSILKAAKIVGIVAVTGFIIQKTYGFTSGGADFFTFDATHPTRLLESPVGDIESVWNIATWMQQTALSIWGRIHS